MQVYQPLLNSILSSVDWNHQLQGITVDESVGLFYDKIYEILRSIIPRHRRVNHGVDIKPWWSPSYEICATG